MSGIESPCTLVCSIDLKTGYCFGCGRTGSEITQWVNYSSQERRKIMETLDSRLEDVEQKPRRITRRQKMKQKKGA